MSLTVGQQIADGQIVIGELRDDGYIKVTFPNIYLEPGEDPFSIYVDPNVTQAFLIAMLNGLKALLGLS